MIFDKDGPYVTENGILSSRTELVSFNGAHLSRLSTFSI